MAREKKDSRDSEKKSLFQDLFPKRENKKAQPWLTKELLAILEEAQEDGVSIVLTEKNRDARTDATKLPKLSQPVPDNRSVLNDKKTVSSKMKDVDDDDVLVAALRPMMRPASQSTVRTRATRSLLGGREGSERQEGSVLRGSHAESGSRINGVEGSQIGGRTASLVGSHLGSKVASDAQTAAGRVASEKQSEKQQSEKQSESKRQSGARPGGSETGKAVNMTEAAMKRQRAPARKPSARQLHPLHPMLGPRRFNRAKDDLNRSLRIPFTTSYMDNGGQHQPPRNLAQLQMDPIAE